MSISEHPVPTKPTRTRPLPLILLGAGYGAAAQFAASFVYQLCRIGWHLSVQTTSVNGAPPVGLDDPQRIVGVWIIGGLLSISPPALAGALVGGILGVVMERTWRTQGPFKAWVTGTLVAYAAAGLVHVVALDRNRAAPLTYASYVERLGLPSIIFVVVMGFAAVWLYVQATRERTAFSAAVAAHR